MDQDELDRLELLCKVLAKMLAEQEGAIEEIRRSSTEVVRRERENTARELLLDASRKGASTRSRERVRRIALILANGITETEPADGDEVEEMMRVAMQLSDREVEFLHELILVQGSLPKERN